MCTQRSPYNWSEQLYARHADTVTIYLSNKVLPVLKERHGEFLLRELVLRDSNHSVMNKWLWKFFCYLDRYYVKYHALPLLNQAGLKLFKNIIFDELKKDVANALLDLINQERDDSVVDRGLMKDVVKIFENMGMGTLDVYVDDLEALLLSSTKDYYGRKGEIWMAEDPVPVYLTKAEQALDAEKEKVLNYLNPETESKLIKVVEEELLGKRQQAILEKEGSGCRILLLNDQADDLSRMYRLFSRIEGGLQAMADIFKAHITEIGNDKIEQRQARIDAAAEKETSDDPQFIKDLLAVHDKFLSVVNTYLESNALFQKALKDAFTDIVNRDVGKLKTAELMSSFCDRLLKTGSTEKLAEQETEEFLEKTVQLFSYLTDKDMFAEIYKNQLAKRLLNQRSASDDMERSFIGKLKMRCGAQFTSKLEGMLNDLSVGEDSAKEFAVHLKDHEARLAVGKLEFSVKVLTVGYWPTYTAMEFNPPLLFQKLTSFYKEFHDHKTGGVRRLTWVYRLGDAEVKGSYGKREYTFQVTTLQAMLLLHFNCETETRSFAQLLEEFSVGEEVLKRLLHSFIQAKAKVLKKTVENAEEKNPKVNTTDSFQVNADFSCKVRKMRIPMPNLDDQEKRGRVEEDRGIAIEAAIVRIMKARRNYGHQQLVADVMAQLNFFRPEAKVVKRRIEALIDREYLERDANQPQFYKYLA